MRIDRSARAPTNESVPARAVATLCVDLAALVANWRLLAARAPGADCAAVVKADAYGIGLEPATRALAAAGCRTFFVATAGEGERLRAVAPRAIVYVLEGLPQGGAFTLAAARLRPVLASLEEIGEWGAFGRSIGRRLPAALQLDTGMNRLGLSPREAPAAAAAAQDIELTLVMSHFICAQWPDDPRNARQIAAFEAALGCFPGAPASLCNSSGVFLSEKPHHDLLRPGYALYGGNPTPLCPNPMRPVVRLEASVLAVREIAAGETVGYDGVWTAARPTRLATLGLGYGDGLPAGASSGPGRAGAEAVIGGYRCPLVGRVSMDFVMLDVTDIPEAIVHRGASAEILGETIGVDELAARSGTIGYEILTRLGRRYERRYIGG
ncbi:MULTISPECIES: alanine racemase [Methylosinus]|uniref:Alanine racemase n=1 Tax=Methylosinus trichosporium (strain ATCC 35070 / NCIMB 11131 / UNIQEM 75 / OB3b) TaxID=595536 RepID=A0A2D2CZZ1_METT3|nr:MULTISPECIES: alanine racemase [Methylosinus]ATQ68310.1 alanine racemase [Methylosinus trichosporium OB3b]OBS50951.1 alanine racemase [Methylosinus sp. 3S-1]